MAVAHHKYLWHFGYPIKFFQENYWCEQKGKTLTVTFKNLGRFGRLGNQLFQLASTIGIAMDNNTDASFPPWQYEPYFKVPHYFFANKDGQDLGEDYLQELRHFDKYTSLIRDYFSPSHLSDDLIFEKYSDLLKIEDKTAIHVRRGDYVNLPQHHPTCNMNYFKTGIDIIGSSQLFVFSDDIPWCKEQEVFSNAYFIEGNNEAIELLLMAKMDNFIISNSTYSWWPAWLSNSKCVIIPEPWYGPAINIDVKATMIPEHWIEVNRICP